MDVQIFKLVNIESGQGQVVYIDDSSAQIKIDNQIFWVSREDLDRLFSREKDDNFSNT